MRLSRADSENLGNIYEDILEEMIAATVLGDVPGHGGDVGNGDNYAKGDARLPWLVGLQRRPDMEQPKKSKKKRAKKRTTPAL